MARKGCVAGALLFEYAWKKEGLLAFSPFSGFRESVAEEVGFDHALLKPCVLGHSRDCVYEHFVFLVA